MRRLLLVLALGAGLSASVSAQTGVLVVTAAPGVSAVYADSAQVGITPLTRAMPAGPLALRVVRVGYAPYHARVEVPAGDTLVVHVALERLYGALDLRGVPAGAQVFVRDSVYRAGPVATGQVPVAVRTADGRHLREIVPVYHEEPTVVEWVPRAFDPGVLMTALITPGVSQLRDRRPVAGVIHALAVTGGVAVSGINFTRYIQNGIDRRRAYNAYRDAETLDDAYAHWVEVSLATDRERVNGRRLGRALLITGAAHALGMADAFLHHAFPPALRVSERGVSLSLSL